MRRLSPSPNEVAMIETASPMERKGVLGIGFLAAATLAVGCVIFGLRLYTQQRTEAAQHWLEIPCVIEKSRFEQTRRESHARRLHIVFSYEISGQTHRSDQLDLLPGSMGDDDAWEKQLAEKHPQGSQAVCYVNPDDHTDAVLDRDHGAAKLRNLTLLSFPFLAAGVCLSFLLLSWLFGLPKGEPRQRNVDRGWGDQPADPPRAVSLLERVVLMAGPPNAQMAWPFLVGFAFVFIIFDGPSQFHELFQGQPLDGAAMGTVVNVRRLDQREWSIPLYEFDVKYEIDGRNYRSTSVKRGRQHQEGDQVSLVYASEQPEAARLEGARAASFTWWYGLVPLIVVALLAFGLLLMYWNNWQTTRLLKHGQTAMARRIAASIPVLDPNAKITVASIRELAKAMTHYTFDADGQSVIAVSKEVNVRKKRGEPAEAEVSVLYRALRPTFNVLYEGHLKDMMTGRISFLGKLLYCLPGPAGVATLWWLFTI